VSSVSGAISSENGQRQINRIYGSADREMRTGQVICLDETTIQVLDEDGGKPSATGKDNGKSYM